MDGTKDTKQKKMVLFLLQRIVFNNKQASLW